MIQPTREERTNMFIQISRVHRKRIVISESFQSATIFQEEGEERKEGDEGVRAEYEIKPAVNWLDFWSRARIYPEHEVTYPDASQHVSSRQRHRVQVQRQRANAYVTESDDSDSEPDVVIQ